MTLYDTSSLMETLKIKIERRLTRERSFEIRPRGDLAVTGYVKWSNITEIFLITCKQRMDIFTILSLEIL